MVATAGHVAFRLVNLCGGWVKLVAAIALNPVFGTKPCEAGCGARLGTLGGSHGTLGKDGTRQDTVRDTIGVASLVVKAVDDGV